jgi:hypothetical protein
MEDSLLVGKMRPFFFSFMESNIEISKIKFTEINVDILMKEEEEKGRKRRK